MECLICGIKLDEQTLIEWNGDYYCNECYDESTTQCVECGETIAIDDAYSPDGCDEYCDECYHNLFTNCQHCDDETRQDELISIDDGDIYVCESCARHDFHICDHCHGYYSDDNMHFSDTRNVCNDCFDNYYARCNECENIVRDTYAVYGDDDETYCRDCGRYTRIHDYNYKPCPHFHGDGNKFYGLELEIDMGNNVNRCADDLGKKWLGKDEYYAYLKHDGSLSDGFEIVSHPCTLEYHMNSFPWGDICNTALNHGFKSHKTSTCGLHIHASRSNFGLTELVQDLNIAKVLILVERFWDDYVVNFSRRDVNRLREWAKKPNTYIMPNDGEGTAIYKAKETACEGRYQAVNLQNYNTVEFRLFRGTL